MNMAIGLVCVWFGCVLIYVAVHGIDSGGFSFVAVWDQAMRDVTGDATNA